MATTSTPVAPVAPNGATPAAPAAFTFDATAFLSGTVAVPTADMESAFTSKSGRTVTPIQDTPYYAMIAACIAAGDIDTPQWRVLPWAHPSIASLPELQARESRGKDKNGAPLADRPHARFYKRLRAAGDAMTPRVYVEFLSDGETKDAVARGKMAPDSCAWLVSPDSKRPVASDAAVLKRAERKAATAARKAAEKAAAAAATVTPDAPADATAAPEGTPSV